MENSNNMRALFIVLNAGFAEDVIDIARSAGVRGATIVNARGAGAPKSFMGITVDEEKEMLFSIIDSDTAEKVMMEIKEKAGVDTPARCICFTMPVDKVVGITGHEQIDEKHNE